MPTLYDNFSQVRQYMDQEKPDLSSYVSNSELESMSYATTTYVADYVAEHGGGGSTVLPAFVPYTYNGFTSYISTYTYNATSSPYLDGSLALNKGNGLVLGGKNAQVVGEYTIANGENAYACADNSVALGRNASTFGWSSLAIGRNVTTWNYAEVALGLGNFSSSSSYTYTGHGNLEPGHANAYKETVFSIGGAGMNVTYNSGWNRIEIRANNDIYIYGVGNYDGRNASDSTTYSLQYILNHTFSYNSATGELTINTF